MLQNLDIAGIPAFPIFPGEVIEQASFATEQQRMAISILATVSRKGKVTAFNVQKSKVTVRGHVTEGDCNETVTTLKKAYKCFRSGMCRFLCAHTRHEQQNYRAILSRALPVRPTTPESTGRFIIITYTHFLCAKQMGHSQRMFFFDAEPAE